MAITVKNMNGHPGPLPCGTYSVRITRAYEKTARTGNGQLALEFEAIEGDHEGKVARSWITLVPRGEHILRHFARAVFPNVRDDSIRLEPREIEGRNLTIKVEWPEGSDYPRVEYYPA